MQPGANCHELGPCTIKIMLLPVFMQVTEDAFAPGGICCSWKLHLRNISMRQSQRLVANIARPQPQSITKSEVVMESQ